jgi:hypothetical protein
MACHLTKLPWLVSLLPPPLPPCSQNGLLHLPLHAGVVLVSAYTSDMGDPLEPRPWPEDDNYVLDTAFFSSTAAGRGCWSATCVLLLLPHQPMPLSIYLWLGSPCKSASNLCADPCCHAGIVLVSAYTSNMGDPLEAASRYFSRPSAGA